RRAGGAGRSGGRAAAPRERDQAHRRRHRLHARQAVPARLHRAGARRDRRQGAREAGRAGGIARQARGQPELGRMSSTAPAPSIVRVGRVDSTQAIAFGLAAQGAADRTVVVAESQAAGRGRRGRVWVDEPGASLLLSVIVRPRLPPARLPLLSLAAGVAVAETLAEATGLSPRLKWPNDVLVDGAKIAGILLESRLGAAPLVVLGIGINLTQTQFPSPLAMRATSV